MGWRDSYETLLELFPQVDSRLIKGAALEHGNDVGAAAEFILNEVIAPEDANSNEEQVLNTTQHVVDNSSQTRERRSDLSHVASSSSVSQSTPWLSEEEARALIGNDLVKVASLSSGAQSTPSLGEEEARVVFGNDLNENRYSTFPDLLTVKEKVQETTEAQELNRKDSIETRDLLSSLGKIAEEVNEKRRELNDLIMEGRPEFCEPIPTFVLSEEEAGELIGEGPNEKGPNETSDEVLATKKIRERVKADDFVTETGTSAESVDEIGFENLDIFRKFLLSCRSKDGHASPSDSAIAEEFVQNDMEENKGEIENGRDTFEDALGEPSTSLTEEVFHAVSDEDILPVLIQADFVDNEGTALRVFKLEDGQGLESAFDLSTSQMQELKEYFVDCPEATESVLAPVISHEEPSVENLESDQISVSIPGSTHEEDTAAMDDSSGSMLCVQTAAISEEMDKADWENVNSSSIIQMNHVEPLAALVEDAQADKEALISSIEEIRVLRLMTDQAEYAARQSREEASRGGEEVMAKVMEMRKMLSRAREANAVHAGEVFGEQAVLATEARELHHRLAQVNQEKAKAKAAMNEIKASLLARIENANREKEVADQEKNEKEALARDALAKEEALVAKVAQESRDLDAEAEACKKIRELLVEHGGIVDYLQGEVAVLREDAEALKKDLESMSLSYSGFHSHIMSVQNSEMYHSLSASRSGKFLEPDEQQPSDTLVQEEGGAMSSGSNSLCHSVRSVSGSLKPNGDKKLWSSLPSLLRALSGSQDLNYSTHSHTSSVSNNSVSTPRDALIVNEGEKSPFLGSENSMTDIKYPSSLSSATSPGGSQVERDLLKAKMAMFPGEDLEMNYSGIHNLDIFRTGKSNASGEEVDEEDWQLLDKASSGSSSQLS